MSGPALHMSQSAPMSASPASPLAPGERETFFAAQARHRTAARLWSLAAELIVALVGLAICVLLAPLGYAVIGLVLDLINLVVRMPNLIGTIADALDFDHFKFDARMVVLASCLPLPGLAMLALGALRIHRLLPRDHAELLGSALGARLPNLADLEESQLRNLVEEIAIAAGRSPPAVLLVDSEACNLGWIGSADKATLVATRGMLDRLGRDQTQSLVALALASIGNGDGAMASRLVRTVELIGLLMMLSQLSISSSARTAVRPLFGIGSGDADDAKRIEVLRHVLSDPFSIQQDQDPRRHGGNTPNRLTLREWLMLPLTGSVIIGVVLIPVLSIALFIPMVGLMWRRRRLLADATAVQFTRYPQALAEAFLAVDALPTELGPKSAWLVNLFMFPAGPSPFKFPVPYPSMRLRIQRLNGMGAQAALPDKPPARLQPWMIAALIPVGALLAVLFGALIVLGTWLSIAINMLFLGIPVGAIHALLRWAAS
ncbi:hypothetical protein BH10PSE17_BH10PSE17_07980 [soil metagenome]